ncbi:RNA polymerase sigma factor [candidate division KSB1 bacterium]
MKSETLMKDIPDEVLVERIKSGSNEAYTILVKRYMEKAYSIAYQFIGSSEDAKDLSQDVFIKIYQSISSFKEGQKFFSWFYRILLNHCINFRKKKSIFPYKTQELSSNISSDNSTDYSINEKLRNDELKNEVKKAISKLPVRQRKVVILCEMEGLTQKEASEILKISEGTVRSRLFYARKKLKKFLRTYFLESE